MREGSLNIEYLEEFIYLADSLSFKRTADHFYVSRSVISRHMGALEEVVGVKLIDRDSRAVSLTEAGEVFFREAKTVLRDWNAALERVRSTQKGATAIVRVGYLRNAARPLLVPFVRHMADAHPGVRLSLVCLEHTELKRALAEHDVDVAIAVNVNPKLSRNYRSTLLYEDSFSVVCAHDSALANRSGTIALEDLIGHKLLLPESYVYAGLDRAVSVLANEKLLDVGREFYQDLDMLVLKVQTEGYVAFSSGKNNAMFGDRLSILSVDGLDTSFAVSAFYHDDFLGDAFCACREGFEWCRDNLADHPPELTL